MQDTNHQNVDRDEIAKFNALASRWWDPSGEFKSLHDINPLRLDYIDKNAGLHGKTVLDVGCGGGILSESMCRKGALVQAIDAAEAPLKVAQLHLMESGLEVKYQQTTAEDMALKHPGAFDIVTCLEMLEHVPDPAVTMHACRELVKPGGSVFFSTINRNPKSYLFAIIGAEYVLRLLPKGTHDYDKFIKPSEMERYARGAGLELQDIIGMQYNPLTKAYRLAPDVSVNYLAHFVRS